MLLHERVTQSLTGRTALVTLLPLSIQELSTHGIELTRDEYIHSGFLPRIYDKKQDPTKAHANYYKTYVERDLRELIRIHDLSSFQVFMKLLAGRVGQVLNRGREPVPIEIKSAMTFHHKAVKGLLHFNQVSGSKHAYLIYSGDLTPTGSGNTPCLAFEMQPRLWSSSCARWLRVGAPCGRLS